MQCLVYKLCFCSEKTSGVLDIFVKSVLFSLGLCIFLKTKEVSEKYTVPVKKAPISQKSPRIPGVFSPQSHLQKRGLSFVQRSMIENMTCIIWSTADLNFGPPPTEISQNSRKCKYLIF